MAVITDKDTPPPELRISWQCERWGALPDAGGVMDQEYLLMHRMAALSNVYNAVNAWREATGERIHTLTEHTRSILRYLKDNGINFNG